MSIIEPLPYERPDAQTELELEEIDQRLDAAEASLASKADLSGGKVPASQLPSYVDDVLEFTNLAAFPATGETEKIYVAKDTNLTYRWTGSAYAVLDPSLALGTTSSTAARGDQGATAYAHSQITSGNPHGVSKADLGLSAVTNTSDADKPVSAAQQTALDLKLDIAVMKALSTTNVRSSNVTGDANNRFQQDASGKQEWGDGASTPDSALARIAANMLAITGARLRFNRSATGTDVQWDAILGSETFPRNRLLVSGGLEWGSGAVAPDASITRAAAKTLRLSDTGLQSARTNTTDGGFSSLVTGDSNSRVRTTAGGALEFGPGNAVEDAGFIRDSAGVMRARYSGTDNDFIARTLKPSGLTGAISTSRYVGATASGAPTSGTFLLGDWVVDQTGIIWVCTAAGSPGTWLDASSSGREALVAESTVVQSGIAGGAQDLTGLIVTNFVVGPRPVYVEVDLPWVTASAATGTVSAIIADNAGVIKAYGPQAFSASETQAMRVVERISTPGTYTRKVQLQRGAGTATFSNGFADARMTSRISVITK